MITLPKDEEAKFESQRSRLSPSSPSSSRSIPFRDSDPSENDALLGDDDIHNGWRSGGRSEEGSPTSVRGSTRGRAILGEPEHGAHGIDFSNAGPPPSFAPYQAEYFEVGNEDICSHDPHLNSDGEALYRFILARAQRPPFMRVHIGGTHTEHKTRWVTRTNHDGRSRQELENYSETVTDFSFCVDIKPVIYTTRSSDGTVSGPVPIDPIHWSVGDHIPAYRGKMVKEIEAVSVPGLGGVRREKRAAKRKEKKARSRWVEEVSAKGLPPWCEERDVDFESGNTSSLMTLNGSMSPQLGRGSGSSNPWVESLAEIEKSPLRSSKTLRQWADEYCASPKRLKEFVYVQELYGWNMEQIESAIRSTILATPYNGDLEIHFTKHRSKIYIRPDNGLSRMLSNKWLYFLSIIFLIFPFIWLFKRFHSRGGGRWEVCGGAYPLKRWVPLEDENEEGRGANGDASLPPYMPYEDATPTYPISSSWHQQQPSTPGSSARALARTPMSIPNAGDNPFSAPPMSRTRSTSSRVMQTASGPKKLLGLREGEWFRRWEKTITRAVLVRYQSHEPLPEAGAATGSAMALDGYFA